MAVMIGLSQRQEDKTNAHQFINRFFWHIINPASKNIRDDKGYWNQIEAYIRDHSEAEFSHSVCPECAKKLYPDLQIYDEKK
jgi:hypothetical protein